MITVFGEGRGFRVVWLLEEMGLAYRLLSVAPTPLVPSYELWVKRREPWLRAIEGAEQHGENRR